MDRVVVDGLEMGPAAIGVVHAAPSTAPTLVLGAVLGIVLLALAGLVAALVLRRPDRRPAVHAPDEPQAAGDDDLPGFLEHPPGSPGAASVGGAGWPALTATAPPAPAPLPEAPGTHGGRRQAVGALAAMAATALLLIGVAAALAVAAARSPDTGSESAPAPADETTTTTTTPPTSPATDTGRAGALATSSVPPGRDGLAARLAFGGVVLERRAVGVTATYPQVSVTFDGENAIAHVELPTFNCLADRAPADPEAAGCLRTPTEYADLAAPKLSVTRDGDDEVHISGRFPTYLRSNGSPPAWTGRTYELTITAEPRSGRPDEDWVPASGDLELGADRARTTGRDGNELRFGD